MEKVSYRSAASMLSAADGVATIAKPTNPTMAMAKATGMLLTSSTSSASTPSTPIWTGLMA